MFVRNFGMGVSTSLVAAAIVDWVTQHNAVRALIIGGAGIVGFIVTYLLARQKPLPPPPPTVNAKQEANPQITQQFSPQFNPEFNPQFNPTIQIGVSGDSGRPAPSILSSQKHEELVIEFLRKKPPNTGFDYAEVAASTNLTKRDARSALERLEAQGSVWSVGQLDAEGGKAYFLDDVERAPTLAPQKKDEPRCNIKFSDVEVSELDQDSNFPIKKMAKAIFENEYVDGQELRVPRLKVRLIFRREKHELVLDVSNVAWFPDQIRYIDFPAHTPRQVVLFFMMENGDLFVRSAKSTASLSYKWEENYEDHPLLERFQTVEILLLTENERIYRKVLRFEDDGNNFPTYVEAIK
jgi:hypothetical protein